MAQLQLDADSRGEGALMVVAAVAIDPDSNTLILENFSSAPVRLRNVRPDSD